MMMSLIKQRQKIQTRAETDIDYRRYILDRCKEDAVFWCNNFGNTFDPRTKLRNIPFILWDKQVELVRWVEQLLEDKEDGVLEKSRDVGASYTVLIPVVLYRWLFHKFNAKLGSRIESYVDKSDDPDSLFWKIDYNLKRLPSWMIPTGFDWDKHRTYMRLSRPDNNNVITGESANENFARAGRNNLTLLDELGFWGWAKASWESCGESTTTRLAVSTPPPAGRASQFYRIISSGKAKTFTFHFKSDPRKDDDWIKKQKSKKTEEEFERELNISYQGSTKGTVYAIQFNLCEFGKFDYNPSLPLFVSWDFGLDATVQQWYQWDEKVDHWYLIDSYENSDRNVEFYVPLITGNILSGYNYKKGDLQKIQEHKHWKAATHYGDPDVKKRSYQTKGMVTTKQVLQKHGIYVQSKPWSGRSHYDLRQKTLLFLKQLSVDDRRNEYFCDCIRNSRYPERTETSQATTGIQKPIHNWTSHARTSLEYMADNKPEVKRLKKAVKYSKARNIFER